MRGKEKLGWVNLIGVGVSISFMYGLLVLVLTLTVWTITMYAREMRGVAFSDC